jgi:hypothetical protein
MKAPELVNAGVVSWGAEARSQKIAGQNQPGFFVFDRLLAVQEIFVEGAPKRANQWGSPIRLLSTENLFKVLQKLGGGDFVAPVQGAGKKGRHPDARTFKSFRFNSRVAIDRFVVPGRAL